MRGRVAIVAVLLVSACIQRSAPPAGPGQYNVPDIEPMPPIEVTAAVSLTSANVSSLYLPGQTTAVETGALGITVGGELGYRFAERISAGVHASIGSLSGEHDLMLAGVVYDSVSFGLIPIDAGGYLHARPLDNVWGGLLLGVHTAGTRFDGDVSWTTGLELGVELGYDVANVGVHRLAIAARATASYGSDIGYGAIAAALAYRH